MCLCTNCLFYLMTHIWPNVWCEGTICFIICNVSNLRNYKVFKSIKRTNFAATINFLKGKFNYLKKVENFYKSNVKVVNLIQQLKSMQSKMLFQAKISFILNLPISNTYFLITWKLMGKESIILILTLFNITYGYIIFILVCNLHKTIFKWILFYVKAVEWHSQNISPIKNLSYMIFSNPLNNVNMQLVFQL